MVLLNVVRSLMERVGGRQTLWGLAALQGVVLMAACGCGTSVISGAGRNGAARQPFDRTVEHQACPLEQAVGVDVNFDGRSDSMEVPMGAEGKCRAADLNFDGSVDRWSYYDAQGNLRRQESDFDRDGMLDEVSLFAQGKRTESRRATMGRGQFDTLHQYREGRLSATLRDSNFDGYVDQWWEYPRGPNGQCPLIHSDVDGDGRPDPGATVDMCEGVDEPLEEGAVPSSNLPATSGLGAVPTEVRSEAMTPPADAESSGTSEPQESANE